MKNILALIIVALLSSNLWAQEGGRSWNFDGETPGVLPQGFGQFRGDWKIVADETAPSRPNVLAQTAKNDASAFNLIFIRGARFKDLTLTVKMKAVAGQTDRGGGVVWRAQDQNNYYLARYNPLEGNFRVYKVEKGKRTLLRSADVILGEGWHTLRIRATGEVAEGFLNGERCWTAKDSSFPGVGMIGLWTKADAQTLFDDLSATPYP